MNKLKTTFNGKTLCVFVVIDKDIVVHLANIDTLTNSIHTTTEALDIIGTNSFKTNHKWQYFTDLECGSSKYSEEDDFSSYKSSTPCRKFNISVSFQADELPEIIKMCSRELVF